MFIRRKEYESMEAEIRNLNAIKESLYAVIESYQRKIDELDKDWKEAYDEVFYDMVSAQEYIEELEEQAAEYMDDVRHKAEVIKEELDRAQEYIEELEEALYEANPNHILVSEMHGYMAERDAIEVEYQVKDEQLLLNAPSEIEYDEEIEVDEVEYCIVIERGLDMVSDVDEVILLRELASKPEIKDTESRIKRMMNMFKPQTKQPPQPNFRNSTSSKSNKAKVSETVATAGLY